MRRTYTLKVPTRDPLALSNVYLKKPENTPWVYYLRCFRNASYLPEKAEFLFKVWLNLFLKIKGKESHFFGGGGELNSGSVINLKRYSTFKYVQQFATPSAIFQTSPSFFFIYLIL